MALRQASVSVGAWCIGFLVATIAMGGSAVAADHAPDRDPNFPWLDNELYKINLDVRLRVGLADIGGSKNSEAYTMRTRAGGELKPWHGISAMLELENTWSFKNDEYFDGQENDNGKSIISDPENTELNRGWAQYERHDLFGTKASARAKGGIQRIIFDDARFVGNVGWRQNEQTYHSMLGETDLGIEGLRSTYSYVWEVQRFFGDQGSKPDFSSDSHFANVHYDGFENHDVTAFVYYIDLENDNPDDSSQTYGLRGKGSFGLDDGFSLAYVLSYAFQMEAANNQADYDAHYVWAQLDLKKEELGSVGVTYELLGSDDGDGRIATPLSTAHKVTGFADAFLDNGGDRGLRDLKVTLAPALPWKIKGHFAYHEFWRADGGAHLGREIDFVFTRRINRFLYGLVKGAWFMGRSRAPNDRWRMTFEINFAY